MANVTNGKTDFAPYAPQDMAAAAGLDKTAQEGLGAVVEAADQDALMPVAIVLPNSVRLSLQLSAQEQVHEVRQMIMELPEALQYSCFRLECNGELINDFVPLSDIEGLGTEAELRLVEAPYTEKDARIHVIRVRELIGAAGDRTDTVHGLLAGMSLYDDVGPADGAAATEEACKEFDFAAPPTCSLILPRESEAAPKTVKGLSLSPWNPPPVYWGQKGHLLYLLLATNEGDQVQITAHVGGFSVNKSSPARFDPTPRAPPKNESAHSLLSLIEALSPSFAASFAKLQQHRNRKDMLATFQLGNVLPVAPWLVPPLHSGACSHGADATRSQEPFLLAGAENTDSLRDWNEEFQSAREMPKEALPDRIFRERLLAKIFAEYNDAAARGAVLVARGEVAPLNPTEGKDAQIFCYNNIFFSLGADGVGIFASEGGDEAARAAVGKDVEGVKLVNQLDLDGLFTPGTVVVDYLGKRIVGQSIVPGIFRQSDCGENSIQYGAVEGKEKVAADERFAAPFRRVAQALHIKKHPVWDKDNKKWDLEASVEMKGLWGTDARKYILDLYRTAPLDIGWIEGKSPVEGAAYPHRMTVLRPELMEAIKRHKMREYASAQLAKRAAPIKSKGEQKGGESHGPADKNAEHVDPGEPLDMAGFQFALNPDVFSGQLPPTDKDKEDMARDELEVRDACKYLNEVVVPAFLADLNQSELSFPMDGRSLSCAMHQRGINIRYLGTLASMSEGPRLQCLRHLCVREMMARSFKHVAAKYLHPLPLPLTSAGLAHLLNCLLGSGLNPRPVAEVDGSLKSLYNHVDLAFEHVSPESLRREMESQTASRFRYALPEGWWNKIRHLQLLREVARKTGMQLQARRFVFAEPQPPKPAATDSKKKKKKCKARDASPCEVASAAGVVQTFSPDDVVHIVPIVKSSAPRSLLAEETLDGGRVSMQAGQKKLGQELLMESLNLHEQIYGLVHPEVALAYQTLSQLYYQMGEKEAAVELARKSVIISERTTGVDSAATVLNYLNLSLFLHQLGDSKRALLYTRHALGVWKLLSGPDHPDTITTINNAAVMLQSLRKLHPNMLHESRRWFEESLRICEDIFGEQSASSASLLFQLSQALALDQEPKAAVQRMSESFKIFRSTLGEDDSHTKEAESWLEQLTNNAVIIAKQEKDAMAKRLRHAIRFVPRKNSLGATATTPTAPAAALSHHPAASVMDKRAIEVLTNFVEGSPTQATSKANQKPGRAHPKKKAPQV